MSNRNLLPLILILWVSSLGHAQDQNADTSRAGNAKVAEIMRQFKGRGVMADDSNPTPAIDTLKMFRIIDGLEIDLVAAEPQVSQPLFLSWDSRGRMWVVQYRQYQFPAGLKIIRYDQHLRAVFDKVPEPPPRGTPGADKISVFEDTDGDGRYDSSKDVIEGLNIATSVQVGHGGIWVLNPPYLLFYPDADRDDVPDGDPEVRLSGFGLQDTHSVANSLLWGPDGWLYGANGSTTIGTVSSEVTKGVSFQGQCIWRYHPDTRIFEIYAEGGGNTFSLDIDSKGRVFSGTNGGRTRGFYYPQGSYSHKNWGKHGPLTNPYAFGFFHQMESDGDERRFAQAFSIYEGGLLPQRFEGSILAPNAMQNLVWHSERQRVGSAYQTVDAPNLLESSDRWFRPVYCGVGPDGGIYIADWYDTRLSHVSPVDDWHKESGRLYRIRPADSNPVYGEGDLHTISLADLLARLDHPNKWVRQRAVLEMGWRADRSIVEALVQNVEERDSLESLWALNLLDEMSTDRAGRWLSHRDPHIRRWVVRLLGDRREGIDALSRLAATEGDIQVRSQLASTAKRIDAKYALPIVKQLARRDEDLHDLHMPLMIWWALEAHADRWSAIESFFSDQDIWNSSIVREVIAGRIMQRYASLETVEGLRRCAALVALAPDEDSRERLVAGLYKSFQGRTLPALPAALDEALSRYQVSRGESATVLALRQGRKDAEDAAIKTLRDQSIDLGVRIEVARTLGEVAYPEAVPQLIRLALASDTDEPALQRVAIRALGKYDDERIAQALVKGFGGPISDEHDLRATGCRTLASRRSWAKALLVELNQWRLKASDVPPDVIQQLRTYEDDEIKSAVVEAFGVPLEISSPEKMAQIEALSDLVSKGTGDPKLGQVHFAKRCATCHKLFGEGETIGPALDAYDRGNLKFWLPAIVEPSLEIREGFQSYMALTQDGRVITGMVAAQDPRTITIRTAENQAIVLERDDLDEFRAINTSLMPEDVLKEMTDQEIKDLFAYLSLGATR